MSLYGLDAGYDRNFGDDSDVLSHCEVRLTAKMSQNQLWMEPF